MWDRNVEGVVETVFAMWFSGERADGLKGVKYKTYSNTTAHNLAYAAKIQLERRMYLVCSVLDLSLLPKYCHTTDITQVTSLFLRDDCNFAAQYFKSNTFNGFCKQVCQLFSSVN